jgi:hypothetical protein
MPSGYAAASVLFLGVENRPSDRQSKTLSRITACCSPKGSSKGSGDLPAPPFLGARLVGEFELGDSVQALDNLMDRVDRAEDSVNPLT